MRWFGSWRFGLAFGAGVMFGALPAVAQAVIRIQPRAGAPLWSGFSQGNLASRRSYSSYAGFGSGFVQPRYDDPGPVGRARGGPFRTLCVRMCDGFYWPMSNAATGDMLGREETMCASSCNGGEARLFYAPSPGSDMDEMVDLEGRSYASYPTAFKYRKTLVKGCQCKPAPWSASERARHQSYVAEQTAPARTPPAASMAPPPPLLPAEADHDAPSTSAGLDVPLAPVERPAPIVRRVY